MISLLPLNRVIVLVAVVYSVMAILLGGAYSIVNGDSEFSTIFRVAVSGSFVLNAMLVAILYVGWKSVWKRIPSLNTVLFPDLNGLWDMTIHWHGSDREGKVSAEATIKQNLLKISMEVVSNGSDSETMLAHPKKDPESGRPILYYLYRVIPKQKGAESGDVYHGAAILKLSNKTINELSGNYFTSQNTYGHFVLTRRNSRSNDGVIKHV